LPVLNKEALRKAGMFGTAVDATINRTSFFDRKSYFYPDSPTAYQITQLYTPIVEHGNLTVDFEDGRQKTIRINRAHIESDAGKNIHEGPISKVDLNRAGTPLVEIVSEPDMRSAEEAILYLKKLHSIVRYLDISDANMQEGSFRVDVNVSIRPKGDEKLYTRVEIKNINSFRFIQKAIELEVARQREAWEDGLYEQEIVQETRLFDQTKQETRSMRGKEGAADYRYFPEPDLLKVVVDDAMYTTMRNIPELPDAKKERFVSEFGVRPYDAAVVTATLESAQYFEAMLACGITARNAITWLTVELQGRLSGGMSAVDSVVDAVTLGTLVKRIEENIISGNAGKKVLDHLLANNGGNVDDIIETLGLKQVSDTGALEVLIDEILTANADKVAEYKSGKDKLFGFFVGQAMKASKGSANPNALNDILIAKLAQ
jgi:aspartyl-tRNA(Asn)/glutamyl-tRNA(Gln) amidotransferase subunit B